MIVKTKINDAHWNYNVDQRDILYVQSLRQRAASIMHVAQSFN